MTQKFKVGDRVQVIIHGVVEGTMNEAGFYKLSVDDERGAYVFPHQNDIYPAPALVEVPQVVSDFIDKAKRTRKTTAYYAMQQIIHPDDEIKVLNDELVNWVTWNSDKFARAWLEGYTVEQEPLYMVELPNLAYQTYLVKNDDGILAWQNTGAGTKFTEMEIKAVDERYWQFAVPVEGARSNV
ncbi:DUF1642 domain-containing protein [Listeria booriae]|uniref:DUF1642 domain-containing protein n=1 Tax=Listeria booriae TaxID=1552123 RepID=UPI0016278255|nr:DUF1642 domain-containing protein [Listeria booriae]MBC2190515.1 DUF1642 domain-containing protein [Listeria booriae]